MLSDLQLQRWTKSKIPYVYRIHSGLRFGRLGYGGDSNSFDFVRRHGIINWVGRRSNWIGIVDNYIDIGNWNIASCVDAPLLHARCEETLF